MTDSAIIVHRRDAIQSMDDVERAAHAMSKSGYFQDARDTAQAIVKILAGREMGFGAFASMTGVYIIQGRPSIGANLMAAAVKASGRYNYRVQEMSDTVCEIVYFEGGQECGRSRFTLDDAKKAGTKNLDKFPRNMLFARAMSNGCRWYCPDVFAGAPTYTPEELGANVNESGEVIDIPAAAVQPSNGQEHPTSSLDVLGESLWPGLWSDKRATIIQRYKTDAEVIKFMEQRIVTFKTREGLMKHIAPSWVGYENLVANLDFEPSNWRQVLQAIAKATARSAEADLSEADLVAIIEAELYAPA